MAGQPPPAPSGPPPDYFMTPPGPVSPPAAVPYPVPPDQAAPQPQGVPAAPWAGQPVPYAPAAVGAGLGLGLMSQFTGTALSSCIVGVITIVIPLAFGYVFYVLPVLGILAGVRAIMRGKMIGGGVGIALNLVGGLVTLIALKA